jgi:hypothetical protein
MANGHLDDHSTKTGEGQPIVFRLIAPKGRVNASVALSNAVQSEGMPAARPLAGEARPTWCAAAHEEFAVTQGAGKVTFLGRMKVNAGLCELGAGVGENSQYRVLSIGDGAPLRFGQVVVVVRHHERLQNFAYPVLFQSTLYEI